MGDGSKGSAGWQTALAGDALSSAAQRGSVASQGGCWLMGQHTNALGLNAGGRGFQK